MRDRLALLIIALALASGVAGAQPSPRPAALSGRVVDSSTGQPIPKADVSLYSLRTRDQRTLTTDPAGRFSFSQLDPGRYTLSARKEGRYVWGTFGARGPFEPGRDLVLEAGREIAGIELKLVAFAAIAGTVVDSDGEPVPRAALVVTHTGRYGDVRLTDSPSDLTNDRGEFRLHDLLPGAYFIQAAPPRPIRGKRSGDLLLPAYYPSAPDLASASPIVVASGQDVSAIAIRLRQGPTYKVQGKLAGLLEGVSATELALLLLPRQRGPLTTEGALQALAETLGVPRSPERSGAFEFTNVEPGTYRLIAKRPRSGPLGAVEIVVADKDVDGVVLPLVPPISLSGTARVAADGKMPESCAVNLHPLDGDPTLQSSGFGFGHDGAFRASGVVPGVYAVQINCSPDGYYVKSLGAAGATGLDMLAAGMDLRQFSSTVRLEMVLGTDSATVTGLVKDGDAPASRRWVTLIPEPAQRERWIHARTTYAGDDGRFEITGVAPGKYRLYAWDEVLVGDVFLDPAFLRRFESQSTPVSVKESQRVDVTANVVRPE